MKWLLTSTSAGTDRDSAFLEMQSKIIGGAFRHQLMATKLLRSVSGRIVLAD